MNITIDDKTITEIRVVNRVTLYIRQNRNFTALFWNSLSFYNCLVKRRYRKKTEEYYLIKYLLTIYIYSSKKLL